jgi:hypothetical protein
MEALPALKEAEEALSKFLFMYKYRRVVKIEFNYTFALLPTELV